MGLRLSVVPDLDGITDVAVVSDQVVCGRAPRRKVVPSLLPRLGAPGPPPVGAVAGGVAATSPASGVWASKRSLLVVAIV